MINKETFSIVGSRAETTKDLTGEELMGFGIKPADLAYAFSLFSRFKEGLRTYLEIGQNFWPSALITEEERTTHLGVVDYSENIKNREEYLKCAGSTILTVHPMDGGLGSSVSRLDYLKTRWLRTGRKGEPQQGAKSTDLYFEVGFPDLYFEVEIPVLVEQGSRTTTALISIMELKYLRLLQESDKYTKVIVKPVVNAESMRAVKDFFEIIYLPDRLNPNSKTKRIYRTLLSQAEKIVLDQAIMQDDLPTIDLATGQITADRRAPGGHGQIGSMVLHEVEERAEDVSDHPRIRVVYNGDGPNNFVSPEMVGFMVKEKAAIVMLSTTKTGVDIKGGLIGVEDAAASGHKKKLAQLLELAQAKNSNQDTLFYDMGLDNGKLPEGLRSMHEPGQQYFNTNVVLINETLLAPFLRRLKAYLGEDEFAKVITPDLIENEKEQGGKKFVQLEGALGSVVLNLNRFVMTDNQSLEFWKEISGNAQFLRIINLNMDERTDFFTPIKYAFDFWLQAYSDHFAVDPKTWRLVNKRPGHLPKISESLVQNRFYMDVQNVVDAFGKSSTLELEELDIRGNVKLQDAVLRGKVEIISEYDGVFDLNLPKSKDLLGSTDTGRLLLENIYVRISSEGEITVTRYAS